MFTTFSANTNGGPSQDDNTGTPAPTRPKRSQVARACDWCRLNRIKCDELQPCMNCRNRGGRCSNSKPSTAASLPAANREIERLRKRVKELEERTETASDRLQSGSSSVSVSDRITEASGGEVPSPKRQWEGVRRKNSRIGGISYYGPSSAAYFSTRMCRYLEDVLGQPFPEPWLEPTTASSNYPSLSHLSKSRTTNAILGQDSHVGGVEIEGFSQSQESNFLNLLWQSFHCIYPILCESDFREHYDSLWLTSSAGRRLKRQSSALVDILLAVCMQYGATFLAPSEDSQETGRMFDSNDVSIAGHWYYRRCQELLSDEMENPTIMTLQSYIFSIIYLCNASFLNSAHVTLAVAIRIAHILGFHLEPSRDLPEKDQHLQRRIWWTLYSLDSEISVYAGRPPLISLSDVGCSFPTDSGEHDMDSATKNLFNNDDTNWLTFHVQYVKLTCAARSVHIAFQKKCNEIISANELDDIYADPQTTESLAKFLHGEMKEIHEWAENVPASFEKVCKGTATPFSTGQVMLNIDLYNPLWLQRQRVLLELIYHNFAMHLYRPFVRFPPLLSSLTPLSDSHSVACLNHAIVTTSIINQVLSSTDILTGWQQIFLFQWNACLVTLGFIIANPVCPVSPSARKSIETALKTLQILSRNFASAKSGIVIVQKLNGIAETLANQCRESLTNWRSPQPSRPPSQATTAAAASTDAVQAVNMAPDNFQFIDSSQTESSQSSSLGTSFEILDMLPPLNTVPTSAGTNASQPDQMSATFATDMLIPPDSAWTHNAGRPIDTWPHFTMDT